MKATSTSRVVVTGGAGFLGSHLCEKLLSTGASVFCVDNFCTGSQRNVRALLSDDRFTLLPHDVTCPIEVAADQIYNLACPASPVHYQRDPVQTTKTCVYGAMNMLGLAQRLNAVILQASTSEVYGDPEIHPQTEDYCGRVSPVGLRSCYDEGKRCAETLCFDYHRQHAVRVKVGRIFNTYGPRMHPDDGRVVSNFIVQALTGRDIVVHGDGSQTRSFCYVSDLIDALVRLMHSSDTLTGPINLGSDQEVTIRELAELVVELVNSGSRIVHAEGRPDDPRRRKPDTRRCEEVLGWRASTPLRAGLQKTIEYFDDLLKESGRVALDASLQVESLHMQLIA